MPRVLRIAAVLLALIALLGVASAAASPAHIHLTTPDAGCDICLTAHMAAADTPCTLVFLAPEVRGVLTVLPVLSGYQAHSSESTYSRGPPSLVR